MVSHDAPKVTMMLRGCPRTQIGQAEPSHSFFHLLGEVHLLKVADLLLSDPTIQIAGPLAK